MVKKALMTTAQLCAAAGARGTGPAGQRVFEEKKGGLWIL
jgi:hypothetical protein